MWGLRDFAVLGAWRVQALELQVRLQHPGHACGTAQAASSPLCLQEGLWELLLGFSTSGTMGGFAAFWPEGCPCAVSRGCEAGGEQGRVAGVSPCTLCHSDSLL